MAKQNDPTPITRAEFEAGVKFYVIGGGAYKLKVINDTEVIADQHGFYYCQIISIDDISFEANVNIFGTMNHVQVLFKNCIPIKAE